MIYEKFHPNFLKKKDSITNIQFESQPISKSIEFLDFLLPKIKSSISRSTSYIRMRIQSIVCTPLIWYISCLKNEYNNSNIYNLSTDRNKIEFNVFIQMAIIIFVSFLGNIQRKKIGKNKFIWPTVSYIPFYVGAVS